MLELVIYGAIVGAMTVFTVGGVLSMTRVFAEVRAYNALRENGLIAMERMTKEIRFSSSVNYAASAFNTSTGRLSLNASDEAGNPKTVEFSLASSTLRLIEDSVNKGTLAGGGVVVTTLRFTQSTTSKSSLIKIELSLKDARATSTRAATFYGSAVLRGAY